MRGQATYKTTIYFFLKDVGHQKLICNEPAPLSVLKFRRFVGHLTSVTHFNFLTFSFSPTRCGTRDFKANRHFSYCLHIVSEGYINSRKMDNAVYPSPIPAYTYALFATRGAGITSNVKLKFPLNS